MELVLVLRSLQKERVKEAFIDLGETYYATYRNCPIKDFKLVSWENPLIGIRIQTFNTNAGKKICPIRKVKIYQIDRIVRKVRPWKYRYVYEDFFFSEEEPFRNTWKQYVDAPKDFLSKQYRRLMCLAIKINLWEKIENTLLKEGAIIGQDINTKERIRNLIKDLIRTIK